MQVRGRFCRVRHPARRARDLPAAACRNARGRPLTQRIVRGPSGDDSGPGSSKGSSEASRRRWHHHRPGHRERSGRGRNGSLYSPWVSVPPHERDANQFPLAPVQSFGTGVRFRRQGTHSRGVPVRGRSKVSLLLLRRLYAYYIELHSVPSHPTLTDLLERARRRLFGQLVLDKGALALLIGMAGAILLLLTGTQILDWYWPVLLVVVSLGVGIYRLRQSLPSFYKLAQHIDPRLWV